MKQKENVENFIFLLHTAFGYRIIKLARTEQVELKEIGKFFLIRALEMIPLDNLAAEGYYLTGEKGNLFLQGYSYAKKITSYTKAALPLVRARYEYATQPLNYFFNHL